MGNEFKDALLKCKDNNLVRSILATGEDKGFCVEQGLDEAERFGMLYKDFSQKLLYLEVLKIAEQLVQQLTKTIGLTKKLLNKSFENNLAQPLEMGTEMQSVADNTYDSKEGVKAFQQKRKQNIKGE
ncbi:MAG: enoyl-CoA hydratase-related protein [Ignavibacteria bacterium]|jgi:2-(1,2-epoxy-1,2-dihydrophenyl)acetyl-CoA isomerase